MEDVKINIDKLNKATEPAADLPRLPDGTIDIEKISKGKNEKGFYIVPDEIMNTNYKELPAGTVNESGTWRASCNGKLKILGGDPEGDKEIHRKGAEAWNAMQAQRQTNKEILEIIAAMPITEEDEQALNLPKGTTNLFAVNYAQYRKAKIKEDTQAAQYIRDTLGEKPTDKIDAAVSTIDEDTKEMLLNVMKRPEGKELIREELIGH